MQLDRAWLALAALAPTPGAKTDKQHLTVAVGPYSKVLSMPAGIAQASRSGLIAVAQGQSRQDVVFESNKLASCLEAFAPDLDCTVAIGNRQYIKALQTSQGGLQGV